MLRMMVVVLKRMFTTDEKTNCPQLSGYCGTCPLDFDIDIYYYLY